MRNTPPVGTFACAPILTARISRKTGAVIAKAIETGIGSEKRHRGDTSSRYRLFSGSCSGMTTVLTSIAISAATALVFIVKPVCPHRHDDIIALWQRQL
jgi:methylglyoxal synthase